MAGIMANLLLLLLSITISLLLCVGLDRIFGLPYFNPSRHELRDLLVALEDLLLPMGSFSIKLLHPWASTLEACRQTPTILRPSLEPKPADNRSKPTITFPSITPASDDSASKPTATTASTERMPFESAPKPTPKPYLNEVPPIDTGLNTTRIPPFAKPVPDDGRSTSSEDYDDHQHFFDSIEYQQSLGHDAQIAEPGIESPHPEQQSAVIGPLGGDTAVLSEEEDQHQQPEGEGSTGSTARMEKLLAELQAFERAIGELVDPDGIYRLDLEKMIELVTNIVQRQAATEESSKTEKVRSQRAEEDLRHGWEDMKEVFERVINGQNATLKWTQQKYDEIIEENETLQKGNKTLQKYGRMKERYINNLKTLKDAKEWAEQDAATLKAEVESRIHAVEERHGQERSATQETTTRDRNSLLCKMRMVQDSLNDARHQVTLGERKHQAALRESYQVIEKQQREVRVLRLKLAVSNEVSAASEQRLQERLEKKIQERNSQITALRSELQESKGMIGTLREANAAAEARKLSAEQMSNHWKEETARLREDKEHVVSGLQFDRKGLMRTIDELVHKIVGLEAGEEVQGLKSQLEESKHHLQQSTENTQEAKQQLRIQKRQMKNLQDTIKAQDQKFKEHSESSSKENGDLQKKLEQALRVTDSGLEEQARKLKEQEEEHSRKLEVNKKEVVENANRKAAEDAKRMEEEHEKDKKEALEKAAKTENDLRIEIGVLKSQVKQIAESKSGDPASAQLRDDAQELIVQTREADEANNLLLEIGTNGIVQDTVEHAVLGELSNAKLALYNVKCELRKRGVTADKEILLSMISSGKMDEQYIQQLNSTTWMQLAKQAKSTRAKLPRVESILGMTGDIQKDAILEIMNVPYREMKKPRGSKRPTQRDPGILPPVSSTGVQATSSTNHSNMMRDTSGQGAPGSVNEGRSSLLPQIQGDQRNSALGFSVDDIDKKHPIWAGVNFDIHKEGSGETATPQGSANGEPLSAQYTPVTGFHSNTPPVATNNAQNPKPMIRPTQVKRDHRPLFADLIASVPRPPASSGKPTTAVLPEPVSNIANDNITSNASPADIPAKTPQNFTAGGQLPLPGLLTNVGTADTAPVDIPANTPGSGPQDQVTHTQQISFVDSSQQDCPSDQPKGWTVDMTNAVEALLDNGHTSVDEIVTLLEGEYENFSAIEGVEDYVKALKNKIEDWTPEMPVGWTNSMTKGVRDMLQQGDEVEIIEDFIMATETALQTNDTKFVQQWVKKLQSDYEIELKGQAQKD